MRFKNLLLFCMLSCMPGMSRAEGELISIVIGPWKVELGPNFSTNDVMSIGGDEENIYLVMIADGRACAIRNEERSGDCDGVVVTKE